MDRHLKQTFDMRYLKIGNLVNGGILQIGSGAGHKQRTQPAGYTTVGGTLVALSSPIEFAVPLQAPVRPNI
ncbi:MAG: hypothetical protein Q8935_06780 [Bacillota bacterium]|nr:hypothetical protein [Bacillota bacterium]MDP4155467.1 hypothetical protein [Bacillota bacterium]